MNKKTIIVLIAILIIIAIIGGACVMFKNKDVEEKENKNLPNEKTNIEKKDNSSIKDEKVAIIYFSATGTTKNIAEKIKNVTNGDLIEIIPEEPYTSEDLSYNNDNCRANKEQNNDSARPKIKNTIDISKYDTIYLGYPIWWGTNPKIILTFLDNYDLSGKKVIPFATSGSSSIEESQRELEKYNSKINWQKGHRFSSNTSENDISSWIKTFNK